MVIVWRPKQGYLKKKITCNEFTTTFTATVLVTSLPGKFAGGGDDEHVPEGDRGGDRGEHRHRRPLFRRLPRPRGRRGVPPPRDHAGTVSVRVSVLSLLGERGANRLLPLRSCGDDESIGEQEAIKCMRHCRRTVLTADDVDSALSLRNVEPIYGFAFGDPLRFKRAMGHKDLFYIDDRDVAFKEVIDALLPKAPLDTAVVAHWLAINGVQPAIPENTPIQVAAPSENKKSHHGKEDDLPVDIKLPVEHVLSRELQMYFDKITELTMTRSESILFKQALVSLATDSGIHPLVPYFSYFIADEVPRNLSDLSILFSLMRVVQSLLRNPHIHIDPYLHQLMPMIITCVVAKKLGSGIVDNHWELRDFSAKLAASICRRYGLVYHSLQSRLMKTLVKAFLDPLKALAQHYGAIQGLAALGPSVVHLLVLPNLETYMKLLEPEMQLDKHKNEIKRKETWRVYGALLCAAGTCLYDRLKLFPGLLSPPRQLLMKNNVKVATTRPRKRKSNDDYLLQQPPLKKLAVDGSMGPIQTLLPWLGAYFCLLSQVGLAWGRPLHQGRHPMKESVVELEARRLAVEHQMYPPL